MIRQEQIIKYEHTLPADFPFEFMWAQGKVHSPHFFHWHDYLELNLIEDGYGIEYIAGREYPVQSGQLYLINNIDPHIAVTDGSLRMRILLFDPVLLSSSYPQQSEYLRPFFPTWPDSSHLAALSGEDSLRIHSLCDEIEREWQQKSPGCRLMIQARLLEILALLYRSSAYSMDADEILCLRKNYDKIKPAVNYINTNFRDGLSLETLASLCGMSRTYFCTVFKQTLGINYAAYLENIRISHACLLLSGTDRMVLDIAMESGFTSLSGFNAAFKKNCGKSPSQYRKDISRLAAAKEKK